MTFVNRLRLLAALLGATAVAGAVGSSVLGEGPGRPAPAKALDPVQIATAKPPTPASPAAPPSPTSGPTARRCSPGRSAPTSPPPRPAHATFSS